MAGAASALFLLDIKGRVLLWRDHRGDISAAQAERFFTKLIEKEEYMLRAEFRLPRITSDETAPERKAPIRVKFEIPYFTVRNTGSLLENHREKRLSGITMAGEYDLRLI